MRLADVAATFSPVVENLAKEKETVFEIAPDRRVGVVSQSGGLGFALYTRGRALGLSFSYVISSGNEVDLSTAHYLEYMVRDPNTQIVMLLCETIRDGERFRRAAIEAERLGKPIIVIKIGRSDAGARRRASHTASLTGWQTAYQRRISPLRRDRGQRSGRGLRHRRGDGVLSAAEGPARRHRHRLRRRRRDRGRHVLVRRPGRAGAVG